MTEDKIEQGMLDTLAQMGWEIISGPTIGPDGTAERQYDEVVLKERLKFYLAKINFTLSQETIDAAATKIIRSVSSELFLDNRSFHNLLVSGIEVETRTPGSGELRTVNVALFDFKNIDNNEFLAVNQLTVIQDNINRRPDVVLFVNGLPLVVIELKNATDASADLQSAYNQIQTYKNRLVIYFGLMNYA